MNTKGMGMWKYTGINNATANAIGLAVLVLALLLVMVFVAMNTIAVGRYFMALADLDLSGIPDCDPANDWLTHMSDWLAYIAYTIGNAVCSR